MIRLRSFAAVVIALGAIAFSVPGFTSQSPTTAPGTDRADTLYTEGSYRLAHEAYTAIDQGSLDPDDLLRLQFRIADSLWRSRATDNVNDPSVIEDARQQLRDLLRLYEERENDQFFAAIHESLGDSYWNATQRDWSTAWNHYNTALDFWASSPDLDTARARYLAIVRKAADPPVIQPWETRGQYSNSIPLPIIENAVEIARSPEDRAYTNFLLALRLRHVSEPRLVERGTLAFQRTIDEGPSNDWYDDALFHYAQTLENRGRLVWRNNRWQLVPDPERALALYRRIVSEFSKGETQYWDQANASIRQITEPSLGVTVSNIFLPGSKIGYQLHWRNVTSAEIELWQVDLTRDLDLTNRARAGAWIDSVSLDRATRVESKTRTLESDGPHLPGSEMVKLQRDLSVGAYILRARAGSIESRELILVTDIAVVTKTSGAELMAFVTDARSGAPIPGARVRAWEEYYERGSNPHRSYDATTGTDGVAVMERSSDRDGRNVLVVVNRDGRQAYSAGWSYAGATSRSYWRIYASTDRPAYRPDETVQWKLTAREYSNGRYTTPANQQLNYEIFDPRGNKVTEGSPVLNEFGSAWAELELEESAPLGIYTIRFEKIDGSSVGSAQLFRVEEYKLPEYEVTVEPADSEDGSPTLYRLGDEVEVEIAADYYFGGPVANATVQVVVTQKPYHPGWHWPRKHPWYFDQPESHVWYGGGQEVLNETVTTGPDGRATIAFDTPDGGNDLEYTIEARVTDASRREITGSANVRVTNQPFYAHMKPRSFLYRPGDRIEVDLRTIDPNDRPVAADGELVVTRETWKEVWIDPRGRKISGSDLEEAKRAAIAFPPPHGPDEHPWRLIEHGYEKEEIRRLSLSTDEDGEATFELVVPREGFYRFQWTSEVADPTTVRPRDVVSAETTVWVADGNTRTLGYHGSGVELVVGADSFEAGTTSPVMIVTESAGSHVLFTVERERIFEHRVVETRGNVTLIELEITDRDIPNIFLSASMVRDLALSLDTEEIVVPPTDHFLDVSVELDRDQYQPRDRGTVTITTHNNDGEPVPAEVSLAVADESVYYIQDDLSGDPRQFFYGSKSGNSVQTTSSFQQKSYVKLAEVGGGRLIDERQIAEGRGEKEESAELGGVVGGVIGGRIVSAPPPPSSTVAESITVTSAAPMVRAQSAMSKSADQVAAPEDAVIVRSDFRSTAFWQPDIVTDAQGTASIQVDWPDSLTTWRATARAATTGADFGIATSEARTKKPLIVRLQAPRFFVVGDQTVISVIINNNTDRELQVTPGIEIEGLEILGSVIDGERKPLSVQPVTLAAGSEQRIEWLVAAREQGTATINVQGVAEDVSDAMERSYLVWEHGIEKFVASSGKVHGEASEIRIDLPAERRPRSTEMTVTVTPSVAITMLDAIPYLIHYPYGCTEQTMSRFLPAAIVSKTLSDLGVPRSLVASRIFGGIETGSADATHPKGKQDLAALDSVMTKGLARLYDFQHADGGWGWWKEGDSDHFMTAYVVWGLSLARDGGVAVRPGVIDHAVNWLDRELVEEERELNRQAWMLHAVTAAQPGVRNEYRDRAFANLWKDRDSLSSYGRALLALSAHQLGNADEARTLVRNLENGVVYDESPDQSVVLGARDRRTADVMATAHWGSEGFWWRWYDGPVETTAFVLRALVTIDPDHRLVDPAMNWLVRNRRGAQWNNTRDTSITILALNEYLERSGELKGAASYTVTVNGTEVGSGSVTPETMLTARSRFAVPAAAIRDGRNEIRVTRRGTAGDQSLYFAVEASYFSTEEPITAEGNEIFVRREYFRMVPRRTLLQGFTYERVPLRDGESIQSGERVDVVVTVETKNDYEYLIFEDLKPAGFEAVAVQSGERLYARQLRADAVEKRFEDEDSSSRRGKMVAPSESTGRTRWIHQELRDRKVVMFADKLEQGVWEMRYELRAEVPGSFHALPLIGETMYVPEIRANSEEMRVEVINRERN